MNDKNKRHSTTQDMTSGPIILRMLLFVLGFHMGIKGAASATILAQFVSAVLTLTLMTRTSDVYHLVWKDLRIDLRLLGRIFSVGLPAGIQSVLTAFSNVFVQSYINAFGSSCMAGWSCYNKLDQFSILPIQSMSLAETPGRRWSSSSPHSSASGKSICSYSRILLPTRRNGWALAIRSAGCSAAQSWSAII